MYFLKVQKEKERDKALCEILSGIYVYVSSTLAHAGKECECTTFTENTGMSVAVRTTRGKRRWRSVRKRARRKKKRVGIGSERGFYGSLWSSLPHAPFLSMLRLGKKKSWKKRERRMKWTRIDLIVLEEKKKPLWSFHASWLNPFLCPPKKKKRLSWERERVKSRPLVLSLFLTHTYCHAFFPFFRFSYPVCCTVNI